MVRNDLNFAQKDTKQALIIGAGIAGLLAARVLSNYYENVLIVERDVFPEHMEARAGVPQAFHVHRLLPRGKMILEGLFPGYVDELIAAGGYQVQGKMARLVNPNGLNTLYQPEKDASCSRALLEWEIRQRVQALPNISFLSNKDVIGLQGDPDGDRISGIYLREHGQLDERTAVSADLVVDASGRTSKLSQWLRDLGYAVPSEAQVKANIGYSTRYYKASPELMDTVGTLVIDELPLEKKSGVGIIPIENNTLWVTLFSTGGKYPSTDAKGFEQEIAHLDRLGGELAARLKEAEALTLPPIAIFNAPTFSLLLDFEAASEGPQVLHELVERYQLPPAEILEKIVPTFSLQFDVFSRNKAS